MCNALPKSLRQQTICQNHTKVILWISSMCSLMLSLSDAHTKESNHCCSAGCRQQTQRISVSMPMWLCLSVVGCVSNLFREERAENIAPLAVIVCPCLPSSTLAHKKHAVWRQITIRSRDAVNKQSACSCHWRNQSDASACWNFKNLFWRQERVANFETLRLQTHWTKHAAVPHNVNASDRA